MKEYFKNCLFVKEEDGWFLPVRLTDEQIKSCSRREPLLLRAVAGAGIAIAFRTAASSVEIEYKITSNLRDYAYYDILIDGVLKKTVDLNAQTDDVTIEIPGSGERNVEIYLPHLAQVRFRKTETDSPAYPLPDKERLWLFYGDSITQGMACTHPSMTYPVLASRIMDCDIINMGVCGGKFFAADMDNHHRKPDLITIAFGTNDWKQARDEDELRISVREYLKRFAQLYDCQNVCAILPLWRHDMDSVYGGMTFERMYEILIEEYSVYPFIHIINGTDIGANLSDFFFDGIHPNEQGALYYAMMLTKDPVVRRALNK